MSEIYFAQIREDSRIERRLQVSYGARRVLTIGSGGCTAFSLLDDELESLVVVDANPAQCALIELKKAALIALELEDYLAFVGERPAVNRLGTFRELEEALPDGARAYWRSHQARIASGINGCGVTDRLYRLVGDNLTQLILGAENVDLLFACSTMDEQRAFFAEHLDNDRWDTAVRVLFSRWTQSHFYPPLWSARSPESKFGEFYAAQIKDAIVGKPVANNYFLHQLLTGRYLHDRVDGTPAYLSDDGYTATRRNIDKMRLVNSTVDQCLDTVTDVDAFYLSNIFDWGSPSQHEALAGKARKASSADGAIVLHRSMYGEGQLAPVFGDHLEIRQELSKELTEQERSMLYREVTVGELVRGAGGTR
ncbi:DUF3419 family protein [Micromonospora sp. NPDC048947]|uniref:DUF3419 family protein n=1 Tax=Micromonospora sp. NPDC048947 TaxID=3154826 RepID=UPI0033CDC1D3